MLIWLKQKMRCPKMPLPPPWSLLADGKTSLEKGQGIGSKDQVGTCTQKEKSGQAVPQLKGELISFRTLVRLTKSLHQSWGLNYCAKRLCQEYLPLYYCTLRERKILKIYTYIYVSNTKTVNSFQAIGPYTGQYHHIVQ